MLNESKKKSFEQEKLKEKRGLYPCPSSRHRMLQQLHERTAFVYSLNSTFKNFSQFVLFIYYPVPFAALKL